MNDSSDIRPFAITAKKFGKANFLYTKIFVVNGVGEKLYGAFANALWDTGCPYCAMSYDLAKRLMVDIDYNCVVKGVGGWAKADLDFQYFTILSNGGIISVHTMILDQIPRKNCSFILGMNFINMGSLALSFDGKFTYLSFKIPPNEAIDFIPVAKENSKTKYISLSTEQESNIVYKDKEVADIINGTNGWEI